MRTTARAEPIGVADRDIVREVESISWHHSMRFGAIVTDGGVPPSVQEWIARAMPADLTGKSVLDVGAWDGYFSFEAERRGAARVLAIDRLQGRDPEMGVRGFHCAKRLLGSRAEFRVMDVMDLDRLGETFDLILFFGVYYHLWDPFRAFQLLYDRLRPGGRLLIEGLARPGREPDLRALLPGDYGPTNFSNATLPWFHLCLRAIGFRDVRLIGGTWIERDAMAYFASSVRPRAVRRLYARANRLAWRLGIERLPGRRRRKAYRALLEAGRPSDREGASRSDR
jgi:SAM-dependent methyltransferase